MYAVVRTYRIMSSVEELGRQAQSDLVPVLKETSGFKAYYLLDAGENRAASLSLYKTHEAASAGSRHAMAWLRKNLPAFCEAEPEVFMGEIVACSELETAD